MSEDALDKAAGVRDGESLNETALADWLTAHVTGLEGPLEVRQFPGGFSNLTYLLKFGERELVMRRPPFGANIKSAHDMGREYRVLSGLRDVYPLVPTPLAHCEDNQIIGAPFYVMERIKGVILRAGSKPLAAEQFSELSAAFVDNLAALHKVDAEAAGLADLGKPQGYVSRQVMGWSGRYEKAATDDVPEMVRAAEWLKGNLPAEVDAAIIHNDYKYDNLLLDPQNPGKIRAVLDWEMATLGDPLMDLGTSLGYWTEGDDPKALQMFGLTAHPGNWNRQQLLDRYLEVSGREMSNPVFYYAFGLFKIGVIVQQIYARYKLGHTKDPRFAGLIHVVRACGAQAVRAIDADRIHHLG